MNPDLEFQGGFVTGLVGGKLLYCMANPPLAGSAAVAGMYVIQPPIVDPVFGLLAVVTPVGGAGGGGSGMEDYTGDQVFKFWDKVVPGGGAMDGKFFGKYVPGGGATDGKFFGKYVPGGGATDGKFFGKFVPGGGATDGKFFGKFVPGGGATDGKFFGKVVPGAGAMDGKFWDKVPIRLGSGAMSGKFWDKSSLGGGSASFVLSSAQIPGRNCLVVHSNFSDLMDALTAAGGATVRFS